MNFALLQSRIPRLQASIPNPYLPLSFEDLGGDVEEACSNDVPFDIGSLLMGATQEHVQFRDEFVTPQAYAATKKATEAHKCTGDEEAAAKAREALQISPLCPDAYVVLAMRGSRSYEEALGHFRTAVEQGTQLLKPEYTESALKEEEIWGRVPMRAWFRGVYGVGNTLRKMGRYREALEQYTLLIKHQPKPTSDHSFHNFHAHLPELWYRVYGPQKCLDMIKRHPAATTCNLQSSRVPWVFTMALANFATGKTRIPFSLPPDRGGQELLKNGLAGAAALIAVDMNPVVVELLAGERPMPRGKIPMTVPASDSPLQAAIYVKECRDLWEGCPGAIPFLAKMRNTVQAAQELCKAVDNPRGPFNVSLVEKCIRKGVFINESIPILPFGINLLGAVTMLGDRPEAAGLARLLLEEGARIKAAAGSITQMDPLQLACYYAGGPEVVRVLMEAGGDVLGERDGSRSLGPAVGWTCNQGNYRELDTILTARPDICSPTCRKRHLQMPVLKLPNQSVLQFLFGYLIFTSCLACVNGGPKCERCLHDRPHGPHVSFTGCVDVLVKHGLRATPELVRSLKKLVLSSSRSREAREMQKLVNYFLQLPGAQPGEPSRTSSGNLSAGGSQDSDAAAAVAPATPAPAAAPAASAAAQAGGAAAAAAGEAAAAAPAPRKKVRACGHCGRVAKGLLKCGRCKSVYFCNQDCQAEAWPEHKQVCRELAAAFRSAPAGEAVAGAEPAPDFGSWGVRALKEHLSARGIDTRHCIEKGQLVELCRQNP